MGSPTTLVGSDIGRRMGGCSTVKLSGKCLSLIHIYAVARLHPTPAVGGVPTESALAFLRKHEGVDRGWYAGPVGWLDADGNGEFMVALRSGVIHRQNAVLFAGCGLVAGSDPVKEYQETQIKFSTMLDGLCPVFGNAKAGGQTAH